MKNLLFKVLIYFLLCSMSFNYSHASLKSFFKKSLGKNNKTSAQTVKLTREHFCNGKEYVKNVKITKKLGQEYISERKGDEEQEEEVLGK